MFVEKPKEFKAFLNLWLVHEFKISIKQMGNQRISIYNEFEAEPNRDPVLRDQKVFPEVRNRPLLPRDFFSNSTFRNSCKSSRGTFGFTHPMSDIHIRPGWSLRRFRNWRLVCSELRIRPDFQIYGSSIGVCNYVIQSHPVQSDPIHSNIIQSNPIQSNPIPIKSNQSINQSNQIINQIKSNQSNPIK